MKKWLLLLPLFVTRFIPLQAQVRLAVFGGAHAANVLETNSIPGWDTATRHFERSRTGFQIGAMLEMPIGHTGLFFQPAFSFITKGRIYDKNNDSLTALATDTIYKKSTLKLTYVEFPLNLTYKIPITHNRNNHIFFSAGPYISFIYSGKITTENLTEVPHSVYSSSTAAVTVGKGPDTYKTWDIGVDARAGFELGRVLLSGYYSRGFTNFYNAPYAGTFHHQVVGATVGFWIASSAPAPKRTRDTDHDGIDDEEDDCPLQPGTAQWHGCPAPDRDHDGVDDQHDSCPTVPGFARYNGCPPPPPPPPVAPPPAPAPEIKKETEDKINYIARNILFKPGSDRLTDGSFLALDDLVPLLQAHPNWRLTIEGYTDNSGTPEKNLQLSSKRAGAVKAYLMSKGVDERQLNSVGYGQEHPIADNHTNAGKMANRRVELKLSVQETRSNKN